MRTLKPTLNHHLPLLAMTDKITKFKIQGCIQNENNRQIPLAQVERLKADQNTKMTEEILEQFESESVLSPFMVFKWKARCRSQGQL